MTRAVTFCSGLEDVLHLVDALLADLRDVHEAVDAVLELHEGAERGHLRDRSLDDVADLEEAVDVGPGVGRELLHAEADALLLRIDVEHDGVDLVALLQDLGGVVHLAGPAHVRDVHHAVDALLELDEGAVGGHVADLAANAGADRVVVADHVPRVGLELAQAERDLLLVLLDAEDDRIELLADLEQLGGLGDALCPGHLGDVDQALDARLDLDERAVGDEVDDLAVGPWRPTGNLRSISSQGFLVVCLRPSETRSFSRFTSMIMTSISSPCLSISLGCEMRPQLMSVMWSRPSMPSRSMNAPKSVMFLTTPLRNWPGWMESRRARRLSVRCCSISSRRERTMFFLLEVDLEDLEVVGLADVLVQVLRGLHVDVRGRHERVDADR